MQFTFFKLSYLKVIVGYLHMPLDTCQNKSLGRIYFKMREVNYSYRVLILCKLLFAFFIFYHLFQCCSIILFFNNIYYFAIFAAH